MAVMKRIPSFMKSPKVSRIFDASAVLVMGINKGVNEAHHLNPTLKVSQEHPVDQVVEKMVSPWTHSSWSPNRSKYSV